ncbi:MAG: PASTA domain-containing protein [Endomicrobiia bacterium]
MPEEVRQLPKGASILVVIFISLVVSFAVSFFSYFFIFPGIEKKYLYVRVPDIRKLPLSEATKTLQSLELNYNIVEEQESEIQAGCVISQQPPPKALVKKNTEILIVLSKGTQLIKIPDLKGKDLQEAKRILQENNLDISEIKEVESDVVEKGFVISQEPQAGIDVKKGFKVTLLVSKGKPLPKPPQILKKIEVPDITDKSLIEAKKILESKGLKLGNVKKVCDEDKDFDIVISQSPKAGSLVPAGSSVNVVYNTEEE